MYSIQNLCIHVKVTINYMLNENKIKIVFVNKVQSLGAKVRAH